MPPLAAAAAAWPHVQTQLFFCWYRIMAELTQREDLVLAMLSRDDVPNDVKAMLLALAMENRTLRQAVCVVDGLGGVGALNRLIQPMGGCAMQARFVV